MKNFIAKIREIDWSRFFTRLIELLRLLLGDFKYSPPKWMSTAVKRLGESRGGGWLAGQWTRLRDKARANPKRARIIIGGSVLTVLLALVAIEQIRRYLDSLPKPDYVEVTVIAPREPDIETGKSDFLRIKFSKSAARIEALNKPVAEGVSLKPQITGDWHWESDEVLVFTTKEQWQIGKDYKISFARKLFPDHVLLRELEHGFQTPALTGQVSKREFYQDPRDPNVKKAVLNIKYNYAIDPEDFKKRVSMTLQSKDESVLGERPANVAFSVSFGQFMNEAYIISDVIPIPRHDSLAKVVVADGVRTPRGGETKEKITAEIAVPGIFERFKFEGAEVTFARNDRYEPEQILILSTKAELPTEVLAKVMKVYLLPKYRNDEGKKRQFDHWQSAAEVTPEMRARLEAVKFQVVPADQENSFKHTFKIDVPVGRYALVEIPAGLKSYGGYELLKPYQDIVTFPEFPRELMIMSQGAILSLSGDKKIPLLARNTHKVRYRMHRVLPTQLNQFVNTSFRYSGDYAKPQVDERFLQTLTEVFNHETEVAFKSAAATQYFSLDIEPYLNKEGGSKRGLFYMSVSSEDGGRDARLILLTDLGVVVKEANDGSHAVFVQNLRTGTPVADAEVEVMGLNSITILSQRTNSDGRANFPDLREFRNEKRPLAFVVKKGGDLSFLPYRMSGRNLTYSQFDVGGVHDRAESDQLTAYLFSDRGIYRPGDTVNLGLMVRSHNWKKTFAKVPILWSVTDARGAEVYRETREVSSDDLTSLSFVTNEVWPTGLYNVQTFITKKDGPKDHGPRDHGQEQIGSLTIRVEEFLPDRLRISAVIDGAKPQGWIAPGMLKGLVSLKNLFGTPAENRRVVGEITLTPTRPVFREYGNYEFAVLKGEEKSFTEDLNETKSNENGEAQFEIDLTRFATGMYNLRFDSEGFEAAGGRGVSASTSTLISSRPFLLGVKVNTSLSYLPKGSEHKIDLIAIDPALKKVAANGLQVLLVEKRFVSALLKQPDGTYKYQSVLKEVSGDAKPLQISDKGTSYKLPTDTPGDFLIVFKDKNNEELNRVGFSVAGQANLSRSLEKNAELQVTLNKQDYQPGEEIEMQIKAPYTGAGLITIERDRVYSLKWFKTSTTTTVERIKIPEGVEGNAYVNVTFLRSLDSKEIFMSPLSYAVMPFSISLADHRIAIDLETPKIVKPGDKLKIAYSSNRKGKIILYGVDEGILQVAKYKLPDPLAYFFQRRALQTKTYQLLDLLLPEFSVVQGLSAPGGDESGRLARNLNPFKRKSEKPVAFWSGALEAGPEKKEFLYEVPDYFNGNLKVMAVASNGPAFGAAEQGVISRGDFVITSNLPTFVTPGDEFEVGIGISNQAEGSGENAKIGFEVASDAFDIIGDSKQTLTISEGREGATVVRLKARAKLGSQAIRFRAAHGNKFARASVEISVRPAVPYMTEMTGGRAPRATFDIAVGRKLLPEFRVQTAGLSPVPLILGEGLKGFLDGYPYGCTEQLASKTFPYVVLKSRAEFKIDSKKATEMFKASIGILSTRQTPDGGFAMYDVHQGSNLAVTLYAVHLLLEAKDRGFGVPDELLNKALAFLESEVVRSTVSLERARAFAYALYLRARSGRVPGNDLTFLHQVLTRNYKGLWAQDLAAGWLAATYKLVKKDKEALGIFSQIKVGSEKLQPNYEYFYDGFVRDTALLYLGARHFPELLREFANDAAMRTAFAPLEKQHYNTHSAAFSILALDALFSSAAGAAALSSLKVEELAADGGAKSLVLPTGTVMPKVTFSEKAEKIRYSVPATVPFYYMQVQSGFDVELPKKELKKNLEITREYLNAAGEPVTVVKLGDEVKVRIRLRSIDVASVANVVIVDLLPSGLEPVLEPAAVASGSEEVYQGDLPQSKKRRNGNDGEGVEEGTEEGYPEGDPGEEPPPEEGYEGGTYQFLKLLLPEAVADDVARAVTSIVASLAPDYVDRREDRVVIYARATQEVREYTYRAKAIAQGKFVVPPAFAESMYDRDVRYMGLSSTLTVSAP